MLPVHQHQTFCCLVRTVSLYLMSKSTLLNRMIDNPLQSIWMLSVHQRQTFCRLVRVVSLFLILKSTLLKRMIDNQKFCYLTWTVSLPLMSKSTLLNRMIDNPLQSIWNIWKILLLELGSLFVFDVEIKTSEADDWHSMITFLDVISFKHFVAWSGKRLCLWCRNQHFWIRWLTIRYSQYGCFQFISVKHFVV